MPENTVNRELRVPESAESAKRKINLGAEIGSGVTLAAGE